MMNDDMKEAVDSLAEPADPSTYTASNGLKLKLRRISQMVIADASRRLKAPTVPMVYIDEKGRSEPNPADPAYLAARREYAYDSAMLGLNVYFIMGTQVVEPLPDGVLPVESDEWVELLEATGALVEVPTSGPRRYLFWLKYYALPDQDQTPLMHAISRFSGGTLEEDVKRVLPSFRGDAPRDAIIGVDPAIEAGLRDLLGGDAGDGTGTGGA